MPEPGPLCSADALLSIKCFVGRAATTTMIETSPERKKRETLWKEENLHVSMGRGV